MKMKDNVNLNYVSVGSRNPTSELFKTKEICFGVLEHSKSHCTVEMLNTKENLRFLH